MGQVIDGMDVLDKLEKLPVGKLFRIHNFLSSSNTLLGQSACAYAHPANSQGPRTVQHRRSEFRA
jgi:hypothetical protein